MKKSMIDEPRDPPHEAPKESIFQELLFKEGGVVLLIILPAVVGFFLWSAMPPI